MIWGLLALVIAAAFAGAIVLGAIATLLFLMAAFRIGR
jgi:hypothetical protein